MLWQSYPLWKLFKEICTALPAEAHHIMVLMKSRQECWIKNHPVLSGLEIPDLANVSRGVLAASSRCSGLWGGLREMLLIWLNVHSALFSHQIGKCSSCHLTLKSKWNKKVCLCLPGRFHPNFTVIIKSYILIKDIMNYNKVQGTCKMNN